MLCSFKSVVQGPQWKTTYSKEADLILPFLSQTEPVARVPEQQSVEWRNPLEGVGDER